MSRIRNRAKITTPAATPAKKAPRDRTKKAPVPAAAAPAPAPAPRAARRPLSAEKLAELAEARDVLLRRCFELSAAELRELADIATTLERHQVAVDDSERQADLERVQAEAAAAAAADEAARPPAAPDDPGPRPPRPSRF